MLDPQPHMPLPAPAPTPPKRTNVVWRFYADAQGAWHWQQLGSDHSVLSDSAESYSTYDECVRGAQAHGYAYAPSQKKVGQPPRANNFDNWR